MLTQYKTIAELEQRRGQDLAIAKGAYESVLIPPPTQYNNLAIGTKVAFARELGGDYYYFADSGDDRLFFCIADISGKSIAAALFSALLHQSIRNVLEDTLDLTEIVESVNANMYASLPDTMFVTLFCALIDDGSISYVNAGHEPPLFYSRRTNEMHLLQSYVPMPIGILQDLRIEKKSVPFEPGDILLAVTDDVTESEAFRDDPFGTLKNVLEEQTSSNPENIADIVFRKAIPKDRGAPADDIIIACIKKQM